jgi:O-glycosyl hydrolase
MNYFTQKASRLTLLALALACKPEETIQNFPPYDVQVTAELQGFSTSVTNGTTFSYRLTATAKDTEGDPLRYDWDFGNGTTKASGAASETVSFAENRDYTVTVRVTDGKSEPVQATVPIRTRSGTVSLDFSKTYQTIEGFGGFGSQDVYWGQGPYTSPEFVQAIVNDLGLTISRDEIPSSLEPTNENADPNVTDLAKFNLDQQLQDHHVPFGKRVPHLKALREAGVQKFVASVWSPPVWMKHNNQLGNGTQNQNSAPAYTTSPTAQTNQLKPENYEEFAEFLVAYARLFEREVGVPLYALSIQNEPRFSQFYQSCVYNGAALRETMRVVGRRFKREGLKTKFFLPEDIGYTDGLRDLTLPALNDPEVREYVDVVAAHGYAFDGVKPDSPDAATWRTIYGWGGQYGKPLWMTETSGFSNDLAGAIKLAGAMHNALRYGNASAWLFWSLSEPTLSEYSLISKTLQKSKRYFVSKNFYRYIRPGAVRVEASADQEPILPLAFKDGSKSVIVLINTGTSDQIMKLTGPGFPHRLNGYRTSATQDCEALGRVTEANGSLSWPTVILPAQSVTTLVSE